jgi:molybdopterin-guanine dinucleotide biosynthesis protein A
MRGDDEPLAAGAIILAGGRSRRMGRDKRLLPVRGRPMIQAVHEQLAGRFAEVLLSGGEGLAELLPGVRFVPDRIPGRGPLMGIASALAASGQHRNLVVPCDMPQVDLTLAAELLALAPGYDAVVPRHPDGHWEPLFAVYCKSILPAMQTALAAGENQVIAVYPACRVRAYTLRDADRLANINTPEDYRRFLREA